MHDERKFIYRDSKCLLSHFILSWFGGNGSSIRLYSHSVFMLMVHGPHPNMPMTCIGISQMGCVQRFTAFHSSILFVSWIKDGASSKVRTSRYLRRSHQCSFLVAQSKHLIAYATCLIALACLCFQRMFLGRPMMTADFFFCLAMGHSLAILGPMIEICNLS